MMTKTVTLSMMAVFGLMFVLGAGCGEKDKSAQVVAQFWQAKAQEAQARAECKVSALSSRSNPCDEACHQNVENRLGGC